MSLWLSSLPLWLSGFLVVGMPTVLAMFGPVVVRRSVSLDRLVTNNEVAGFKYAVLGVVYAVMLGFAVIVVWEKFRDAESAVIDEAGAAWAALSTGAFVTVCFTFFFGTSSLRAQTMMTGMISVLIVIAMFVVVTIDHPFTGPVSVRAEALEYVLHDLGGAR